MGGIFLIQDDDNLLEMTEQPYQSEDLLQELLAKYPNLLAGNEMNPSSPRRWLLVTREMAIPDEEQGAGRWSLDHLFLDQDAIPTLVEIKRSSDTRIRREVVGQMLDYAANAIVYWPVEEIRAKFETQCERSGADPEQELADFLDDGQEPGEFWQQVKTNLQAGRIRMVFVSDEIPAELRRIVEFLNSQMDPAEVLAVEIKQFIGEKMRSLTSNVIGQTTAAQQKKAGGPRSKRQWDEVSFLDEVQRREGEDASSVVRAILGWAKKRQLRLWWGSGSQSGSFFPMYDNKHGDHHLFACWTYGGIELQFQHMKRLPFRDINKRREIAELLSKINGVHISEDSLSRRPSIRFDVLKDQEALERFLGAFDHVLEEYKAHE